LLSSPRRLVDLVERGIITPAESQALHGVEDRFELGISEHYLGLIDPDDPRCPIRLQAIPTRGELNALPGEEADPIGDHRHAAPPLLVHRYPDRVLLMPTLRCPLYCRFCFRKVLLADGPPVRLGPQLDEALDYLRADPRIHEVILSGGDPLLLGDGRLDDLLQRIRGIAHIRRIRIHTRVPATLPSRFTPDLVAILEAYAPLILVSHVNHPREIAAETRRAWRALARAGVMLLSQSVLMKGINDDGAILAELFEDLLDAGVKPYYLHHLDNTVGTAHFRVSLQQGMALVRKLRGRISGTAIPAYVMEIPGGAGKIRVDSSAVTPADEAGTWWLNGPLGERVLYDERALGVQQPAAPAAGLELIDSR